MQNYFKSQYPGVKEAVNKFINDNQECIKAVPIGYGYSLAIVK